MQAALADLASYKLVGEARGVGLIAALELVAPEGREDEFSAGKLGARMNAIMLENGLISRNMLDAMAFCPPLTVSGGELNEIINITRQSLKELEVEIAN